MGRININFHVTTALALVAPINPDAIPARDLAMVLLSLPGTTYITGCATGIKSYSSMMTENTIEATNDRLPDGTNITVNYKREVTMLNGKLEQFTVYSGMDIQQPSSPSAYQAQSPAANPAANLPVGASVAGSGSLGPCHSGHNWKTYTGMFNTEEFCTACGIKK